MHRHSETGKLTICLDYPANNTRDKGTRSCQLAHKTLWSPLRKPYETVALGRTVAGQSAPFQNSAPFHRLNAASSAGSWRVGLEIKTSGRQSWGRTAW